jgi:hypothetical protein
VPDQQPTEPERPGVSRRTLFAGVAGIAGAAVLADPAGIVHGITGGAAGRGTAAEAAGMPVEPRHGAGEWTEDPAQAGLSQSPSTIITGDIAAAPLDRSL